MITLRAEGKIGEVALKGFDQPARTHAVNWAGEVSA